MKRFFHVLSKQKYFDCMANNMLTPCFPIETSSTVDPTSGCDDNEGLCRLHAF